MDRVKEGIDTGWMSKSKNGNGNCNSDEDDDIADMICTMKISLEEIKGNRAAMNAGMDGGPLWQDHGGEGGYREYQ